MQEVPDMECLNFLIKQNYLKNVSPYTLLKDFQFKVPLNNFICYCIGTTNGIRQINCLRIIKKKTSDKITTIEIEWFSPKIPDNTDIWESIRFWVNSTISLRKFFFCYEDKLNFFRSTFIYYPEIQQYFRLCNIFNYLQIDEINPVGETIYMTCLKKYIFRMPRKPFYVKKRPERRKMEIKKYLSNFLKKHNIDRFIEIHYPNLFREIKQLE